MKITKILASIIAVNLLFGLSLLAGPDRVVDFVFTKIQGTSVSFSWTAPTNNPLLELDVRQSTNAISALNFLTRTRCLLLTNPGIPGSLQNASVTGLQTGTTYYFALRYRNSGGWSTITAPIHATTMSSATTTSATLAWTPSIDTSVVGYNIYYYGAGQSTNRVYVGNVTQYLVSNLTYGVTYTFYATTVESGGSESGFSNPAFFTP